MSRLRFSKSPKDQIKGLVGQLCLSESRRKARYVTDKAVIGTNQRPAGKSGFDRNEYVVPIKGDIFPVNFSERDLLISPVLRVAI